MWLGLQGKREDLRKSDDKLRAKKFTLVLSRKRHCDLDKSSVIRVPRAEIEPRN